MVSITHYGRKLSELLVCGLALLLIWPGFASAQNYLSVFRTYGLNLFELSPSKSSCCGANADRVVISPLSIPEYETYKLLATYYSLRDDLTTTLMLNNKGSEPILAWPTFYSLSGTRLQLAPITVAAASYLDVDMHQLLAYAGDGFHEGSVNIAYQGGNQQLGAQVKMVDAQRRLIWAEQLVYGSKFISSRLETVWWLPFNETETRVVVSNTSGDTISATIAIEGTAPRQQAPANLMLGPWETRVLDIMTDLVGHGQGIVMSKGGISLVHTGSPGAVLARMFISAPNRGYSAASSFIDPETSASQRWHGSGLKLKNLDGTKLEPVLTIRNTSDQLSRVQGRIIYTGPDGSTSTIAIRQKTVIPGATRVFNLDHLIENENVPSAVTFGGIELEYDTPKGSVIASVQSVSRNGDHVFQVPIFDPQSMPSSAGGFPWKAEGDYRTIVYIKNETDVARKFVSHLLYEGGQYSPGIQELRPGETIGIDFRELRDNQSPDSQKHVIPSHVYSGQIGWSVLGSEDKVLSGRSEQISLTDGVASTYACANCCPNVIYGVYVNPISLTTVVNSVAQFTATQTEQNCYNQQFGPYQAYPDQWNSFNYGVATIDYFGNFEAVGVGDTSIQGCVERTIWYNWGGGYCEPFTDLMCDAAPVEVFTLTVDINPSEVRPSGTGGTVTATVTVSTNPATSGQSVTLFVVSRNDGGHVAHTGTRPLGSFGNSQGTTGADGKFSTTYTASDFGGGVDIIAKLGTYETLKYLEVRVADLGLIATTNDWNLVGETTTHPVNHYGTAGTNVSLAAIARDYNDQYYGVGQFPPDASKLRFNDMALINGGKFDLTNNWSTTAAHQEHRLGLNCDFYSGNVPTARWTFLTGRFVARGSPNYVDETQALNHWHLRFSE